jgi:hypothetical protein
MLLKQKEKGASGKLRILNYEDFFPLAAPRGF